MSILANGDLVKLGTFYKANTKQLLPTRPWRSDHTPPGASGNGNIPIFRAGQSIEIRDTDSDDAYQLRWRKVNVGSKKLLVADRNILEQVSWDDLNSQGLIFGKKITIDGHECLLRVFTGGEEKRGSGPGSSRSGGKLPNEWDDIIVNEGNYSGLPVPKSTDLDSNTNATDYNEKHNQFWNWIYMYSWCQETYLHDSSDRAIRSSLSARNWLYSVSSVRTMNIGWRPVLEVLNSAPLITGDSQNQGNKTTPFSVIYQVSDPENDPVNVVEKLNGTTINTRNKVTQGVDLEIEITTSQWASLPLSVESTITIEATDSKGAKSTRTYTFTKTNAAPSVNAIEPLGDLSEIGIVDTTTPIFVWSFSDSDPGDRQSAYQFIIEDTDNNVIHDSGKKQSTQSFYQLPAQDKLSWGVRYKWKVRVWDKYDLESEYSFPQFLLPNRAPTVSNLRPGSTGETNPQGASLNPTFEWDFEDLDIEAQAAYRLNIFNLDDSLIYDSSKVYQNREKHTVPTGILSHGETYYAIVKVWDPNNLTGESERVYIRTNATPTAPLLTGPTNNYRTTLTPTFTGIVGTDPENDGMHFIIQVSTDETFETYAFEKNSITDRAGWKVGGYDIPVEGVKNDQQGQNVTYTMQADLDMNRTYYWRMAAVDASTDAIGEWSDTRKVRAGNELTFEIKNPIETGAIPAQRILFAADCHLPSDGTNKATILVEFSNNALDVNPTWENATNEFLNMDYYEFTNTEKTAADFAIGARLKIVANDSKEPIYIDAIGLTFD